MGQQVIGHIDVCSCVSSWHSQFPFVVTTLMHSRQPLLQPKTLREIRRDMYKMREWRNELDRMKISQVVCH